MPLLSPATGHVPRIAVVGSFMQACCWQLDALPRPGETRRAASFATEPAGKGLGVAVGCHRLGAQVATLMAIGDDAAGDLLLRWLADEGLDARHVYRRGPVSGHGAGLCDASGANLIAVHPGANAELGVGDVAAAEPALAAAALVYGQLEVPPATVEAAFALARRHGVKTVLNPSPWQELPDSLLALTDVLIVNAVEAEQLLGLPEPLPASRPEAAARLRAAMPRLRSRWPGEWLVATLGAQGSIALDRRDRIVEAPARELDAAHTVGAGDAFSAGWCVASCLGAAPREALQAGNICGALAVSRPGILTSLPRAHEVQALLSCAA